MYQFALVLKLKYFFSGIFKVLPIFALSYACQSQLFIIYSTMADPPVERMRGIMMKMLSIVASIYALVGILGYSSFHAEIKGTFLNFRLF